MLQAVLDVALRLFDAQRPQVIRSGDTLAQLLHRGRFQQATQLRLTHQKALQQRLVAELEVRQHAQLFDSTWIEVLRLVDDQQSVPTLRGQGGQKGLEGGDQVRLRRPLRRNAERGDDGLQQFPGLELRADDLCRQDLLAIETLEKHAHQGGLASTDLTGDDNETFRLSDTVLQVGQRTTVATAIEVERRIGIELKRLPVKTEVGLVHRSAVRSDGADRTTRRSDWR